MDTGFPREDVKGAFSRELRRSSLANLAARLRLEPDDVSVMLPFEEVVDALGRVGERDLGVQFIPLHSIVGTVDRRAGEFDRSFRPATGQLRSRWERIASARRRGDPLPPIEVYRVGDMHFVADGHHRVSVARAMGDTGIEARVREVQTKLGADRELRPSDLPLKQHERVFHERVPLPPAARDRIKFSDEWRYAQLATLIESWGFRLSHARERLLSRREVAEAWFHEAFEPVMAALDQAGLGGRGTEAERYLRVAMLRDLLLYTNDWSDGIIERLRGELRPPSAKDDTMVHQILKEMR